MKLTKKLVLKLRRMRASFRRRRRLLFPSPAEVKFVEIFGGSYITFSHIKDPHTGFPFTIITSLGKTLERELVKREIRVGKFFVDFGTITPYYCKGIEIDGKNFHQDITKEVERDEYCGSFGWSLFHIQAASVYREPMRVRLAVLEWLSK